MYDISDAFPFERSEYSDTIIILNINLIIKAMFHVKHRFRL